MKRMIVLLLMWALVGVAGASDVRISNTIAQTVTEPINDPTLVWRALQHARDARRTRGTVRSQAVASNRSARTLLIPAAGSTPGAGGLFFRSDVTLANYNSAPQDVAVAWWPAGTVNPLPNLGTLTRVTIPPSQSVTYVDFVANVLKQSGLGALLFIPVAGTEFDEGAAIDAFSRIYTQQPGSSGSVSQPFPAVDADALIVTDDPDNTTAFVGEAIAIGLRQDAAFRTNFGIVNEDTRPHNFHVHAAGERGTADFDIAVPPNGMIQQSVGGGDLGAVAITFTMKDFTAAIGGWVAYASSTDNVTGDGWVSIASADFNDSKLTNIGK